MSESNGTTRIRRQDYRPPAYRISDVDLTFELDATRTRVSARLTVLPTPAVEPGTPLRLDGREVELESVRLNGRELAPDEYTRTADSLVLPPQSGPATVEVVTVTVPERNTALMGLYASAGTLLTQCEPEGFRRITYYLDRPDVLAVFSCQLIADPDLYPVLLSNGDVVETGTLPDGRHWAQWHDPHPKPSYLFALVAGRLERSESTYLTASGRPVTIELYADRAALPVCSYALAAVGKAMAWDEQHYGLECDLGSYRLVNVPDFNMGAMENKGLNIFNSLYLEADPRTAVDEDIVNVHTAVAHEYFHNWTGNRVTLRDLFQLSLKEGLAVYRDQEFTAGLIGRGAQRVRDVRALRAHQFAEDAGPQAHPVRPDEYQEISNFFTWTVYKKGSEVVRMLATLLGPEGFRRGLSHYLENYDGQAATCDQFVDAMARANDRDLSQFLRWYDQAGTPVLDVTADHDPASATYALTVRQSCPPTPGQPEKTPLHIPLRLALLDQDGQALALRLTGEEAPGPTERVVELREEVTTLVFQDVPREPVPSLLRGFSAPVRLNTPLSTSGRLLLAAHDEDPFVRWESLQATLTALLLDRYRGTGQDRLPDTLRSALAELLAPGVADAALMLQLPSYETLFNQLDEIDPVQLADVLQTTRRELANSLYEPLLTCYRRLGDHDYRFNAEQIARRNLRNTCLDYLATLGTDEVRELALRQYRDADNMTDRLAALTALADGPDGRQVMAEFAAEWGEHPLVMDKWFATVARSSTADTLARVRELTGHPAFSWATPNRVAALVLTFCFENPRHFHAADGSGYRFAAEQILRVDEVNPQVSARLAGSLGSWRKVDQARRELMREALQKVAQHSGLSLEASEVVTALRLPE